MADEQPASSLDGDGLSECVICFTPYDTLFHLPKVLSCGHVFCLECLSRITVGSTAPESLPCPVCREPTSLPKNKGPPALSTDKHLLSRLNKSLTCPVPSLRFNRKRGLLYVPQTNSLNVSSVSLSVDLGRPPPEPHSPRRLCLLFRSGGCIFYGSIVLIVALTVALVLAGVYIFYLLPWHYSNAGNSPPGSGNGNNTLSTNNATIEPDHH
ncbi:RING finger protein 225-like [Pseudophryne corroboree]|uniref:RING finger protein 225-like n=1 Tax=Pseudophryne corroboree TaxID=495146 RepID=UPI003081DCAE